MNGSLALAEEFCTAMKGTSIEAVDVVLCPPYPFLTSMTDSAFALGAQNVSAQKNGAHTGEVSADMLKQCGCEYVIVGHSERRQDQGESSESVAGKALAALRAGLTPVICVGEPLDVREKDGVNQYIADQLAPVLETLNSEDLKQCVLAYEPIWAIGTGKTASPEQAQAVHAFIRKQVSEKGAKDVRIVYGGSVKPDNAATLFAQQDIDGGLIGGASLKVDDFVAICQAAN
ncbi:triosephosphate isomerase [Alteromonas halophila]|uniref:Triosephosphate isomerase n=2 Tax=Alteromonas halophila TaxID=516698 RepID=A0A918MWV3_9ALTE|nr:triosephosphate isomerase [Alteromonas halophila]